MRPDVIWANGMEGRHVHGRDEVRSYWKRLMVFRKDCNEKSGNRVITLDIDDTRPAALTLSPSRNAKFAKSTGSFHGFPRPRIGCNRQNTVGPLFLAEEFFSSRE